MSQNSRIRCASSQGDNNSTERTGIPVLINEKLSSNDQYCHTALKEKEKKKKILKLNVNISQ